MRLALLITLLPLLCSLAASAISFTDLREWESNDGNSIRATLLSADKTHVRLLVRGSGKKVKVPLTRLAKEEQDRVLAWLKDNPDGLAPPSPPHVWPNSFRGDQNASVTYLRYDEKQKVHVFRSKYYDIYTDQRLSDGTVSKCATVFDSVVGAANSLPLGLRPIPAKDAPRYKAVLVSTGQLYAANGGPPRSAGVYLPSRGIIVVPYSSMGIVKKGNNWVFDGANRRFTTLIHELTHQCLVPRWPFLSVWFHEGMADYLEAMPYRSGQFLFTNPASAIVSDTRDSYGRVFKLTNGFPCYHLEHLLNMEHSTWNITSRSSYVSAARNYGSAKLAVWYFSHADGDGNGSHFVKWIHAMKALHKLDETDWGPKRAELTKKHLLRDRKWSEVEAEMADAFQEKGLRVIFGK